MTIRVSPINLTLAEEEADLRQKAAQILQLPIEDPHEIRITKKSLDARRKNRIHFVYAVELSLSPERERKMCQQPPPGFQVEEVPPKPLGLPAVIKRRPDHRPLIVGTGPAGLFAAWKLTQSGLPPLILERGMEVTARVKDVNRFWEEGRLEEESNVQFGEGGAGTFSDGKLYTRLNDPRISEIVEAFVRFGAPPEIQYLQRPHIGTDRLRRAVTGMRQFLQEKGAEFRFQAKVTDLKIANGKLEGAVINEREEVQGSILFLALGHSARDTYRMLYQAGVSMEPKPFAVGLRVEHPQRLIDRIQYGPSAGHPRLPPAEYQLTHRTSKGRAVYSFCMCPGGAVIGSSSQKGTIVTNGMSFFRRNSPWANSALVVGVGKEDFGAVDALAGMEFQRRWEEKAFHLGGGNFKAPAQAVLDFLGGKEPGPAKKTSFRPGVTPARLDECLPGFVVESLREAIPYFDRKMRGFSSKDAMLMGVETRTSSPIRILRREDFQSQNIHGLSPIGEGSGYSGGIISSALDGMKAAEAVLKRLG
jgi:uncharacterized FAD-dependent dehydrogenase